MKTNVGTTDKMVRLLLSVLLLALYTLYYSGISGFVLSILVDLFLITSFLNFCPLYVPFGISTIKKNK